MPTPAQMQMGNPTRPFRNFLRAGGIPGVTAIPANYGWGPMDLGITLPTAAALTSCVTDGALYYDPQIRSIYTPSSGGTGTNQSVGLVITGCLVYLVAASNQVYSQATVAEVLAANPTLEWTIGGITRARSLIGSLRTPIIMANGVDSDQTTPTLFAAQIEGKPLVLPTMNVCPKQGDTIGIRTEGSLTATIFARVRFYGGFLPSDELASYGPRQSQGAVCSSAQGLGINLIDAPPEVARAVGDNYVATLALRSNQ